MDSDAATSIIFKKIRTLEPANAQKIIGYFLMQDMNQSDLIRLALGPDSFLQNLCRKAKFDLGLSSDDFSVNPHISRPINLHRQPLSLSSPRNEFFEFSRNPFLLSPPFTPGTLNPFHDPPSIFPSSSGEQSFLNEEGPLAILHKRSFSANDACLDPRFGVTGYGFPQSGLVDDLGYFCLQREEMMRMKLARQQRMAMDLQRQGSEQFGEEGSQHYYRHETEDLRKIYMTFPSESSFTDADVYDYFGNLGTVEDVRISNKEQRMYGFVTFDNAETVRLILALGNPHFICDWPVRVKPYKEKEEILQKKRQQRQLHADSLQAIDLALQRKRFLNMQLLEKGNESIYHHQRSLSSVSCPAHLPPRFNHNLLFQSENYIEEVTEGDRSTSKKHPQLGANSSVECGYSNDFNNGQETSLENILPDNFFDSPQKTNKTRQTKSDTEENKTDSSDQSA